MHSRVDPRLEMYQKNIRGPPTKFKSYPLSPTKAASARPDGISRQGGAGNNPRMVKSMSREEPPCQELSSISDDMQEKSRVLMAKNLDQTKKFFSKLKGCIDFLQVGRSHRFHN